MKKFNYAYEFTQHSQTHEVDFRKGPVGLISQSVYNIKPGMMREIPTGLILDLPKGLGVNIFSTEEKISRGVLVVPLVKQFEGQISVFVYNISDKPLIIQRGDHIADAVLFRTPTFYNEKEEDEPVKSS